jgi:hypothetical protein
VNGPEKRYPPSDRGAAVREAQGGVLLEAQAGGEQGGVEGGRRDVGEAAGVGVVEAVVGVELDGQGEADVVLAQFASCDYVIRKDQFHGYAPRLALDGYRPGVVAGAVRSGDLLAEANRPRGKGFRLQTSDFRFRISDSGFQISDFRISDFRLQASDFRLQIHDFRFQASGFRLQTSDFRLQIHDFRFMISDSGFQISDFRFRISDSDFRLQAPDS